MVPQLFPVSLVLLLDEVYGAIVNFDVFSRLETEGKFLNSLS